jgi:anti-anti-sigma factor
VPPPSDQPLPGTVEVAPYAPGLTLVSVHGELDLSTTPQLAQALELAAADSNVLVDLSDCSFVDSSGIQILLKSAQAVEARGEHLALVIPTDQGIVARMAHITRLSEIVRIYPARAAALASMRSNE